jgi:hypothetical protein
MTKAGQQINVRGPRADAVHGGECCVRVLGGELSERGERKLTAFDGAGDFLQRADFRCGQPKPRQPRRAGAQDRRRIERLESRLEPSPNGAGARGRKLLRHDDGGEPGETIRPPTQRRPSSLRYERGETRFDFAERGKGGV